jgi:hypothetical protein
MSATSGVIRFHGPASTAKKGSWPHDGNCWYHWGSLMKKALITGITGHYGSYLAEFLLEQDYETTAREMCTEMVAEDLKIAQRHALLKAHGLEVPVSIES